MNAIFNVVMLKGEEEGVAVGWFAKVVIKLLSRSGSGGEERTVAFVQEMEVTTPLDAVQRNLGGICVR